MKSQGETEEGEEMREAGEAEVQQEKTAVLGLEELERRVIR